MNYQISKYEAIKAVLNAEKCDNQKLAYKMMQVIRRAVRQEIESNSYTSFYIFNEQEKTIFENVSCTFIVSVEKNK